MDKYPMERENVPKGEKRGLNVKEAINWFCSFVVAIVVTLLIIGFGVATKFLMDLFGLYVIGALVIAQTVYIKRMLIVELIEEGESEKKND